MIRLFIALKIPADVREKIFNLPKEIIKNYNDYKWEKFDKIHLTLKFIGEVKKDLIQPIIESMKFIENYSAFECSFTKLGFFYRFKEPKTLWLGLSLDDTVKELVKQLNENLAQYNIPIEKRDFRPHLTMMRIKGRVNKNFIDSFLNFRVEPEKFISNEISLMESKLEPAGSIYSDLKVFNLK